MRLFTKSTAIQYAAEGIRCNSVHPGIIETPMTTPTLLRDDAARQASLDRTPIGRVGQAEDVAWGVLFLASDESSFMTGSELVIDGGLSRAVRGVAMRRIGLGRAAGGWIGAFMRWRPLSGGGTAQACSCAFPPGSPAEELAQADAVFAGVATSVKAHRKLFILPSSSDPVTIEFDVSHVWKGPQQETLTVKTVRSEASCGYEFQRR